MWKRQLPAGPSGTMRSRENRGWKSELPGTGSPRAIPFCFIPLISLSALPVTPSSIIEFAENAIELLGNPTEHLKESGIEMTG
jgi:hypothetical protein